MTIPETQASTYELELKLQGGEELRIPAASRDDLDALHTQLETTSFVHVGEDMFVRSSDVRYVRLREVTAQRKGGEGMGTYETDRPTQVRGGQVGQPTHGYGDGHHVRGWNQYDDRGWRGWNETKPFFLTSEFLTLLASVAAIALAMAWRNDLPDPRGWTLIAALCIGYMVSRGIAKAGSGDRRR